ncbi:hypothetical protein [Paenibacillus sp. FSL H7-0331]|uniref:hypothetical protein n=1 Tax=Paenibacillus sp. FSL H7-0331 TaxID=1920421 RepID=UPI00096D461A|nr:hypothetical protein [Paenibacillus sp. FSL H7-0331]OME99272.1 hypothetical protein BK127_38955 [Paenibacillus sp. FSL H7-0331]
MELPKMFDFNQDVRARDKILGLSIDWEDRINRIIRFDPIQVSALEDLINNQFINPDEKQNNSPTVQKIFTFMKKFPVVFATGYAVTPKRKDYRVSIEGLAINPEDVTEELENAFKEFSRSADELITESGMACRWS